MRGHNNSIVPYVEDLMDQRDRIFIERLTYKIIVAQTAYVKYQISFLIVKLFLLICFDVAYTFLCK